MKKINLVAASIGVFYKHKYGVNKTILRAYSQTTSTVKNFPQLVEGWFKDVEIPVPVFKINGEKVKVLKNPQQFYEELMVRIFFLSFYIFCLF